MQGGAQVSQNEPLKVTATAPAKAILFGEHATLYGQPAVAVALDLRLMVKAAPSRDFQVNRYLMRENNSYRHKQITKALELYWSGGGPGSNNWEPEQARPLHFHTSSQIPSASGLGSSSAFTVATLGAMDRLEPENQDAASTDEKLNRRVRERIAHRAWEVEWACHGKASPLDTSCATFGGGVMMTPGTEELVNKPASLEKLWRAEREEGSWQLYGLEIPPLELVVAFSGTKSKTGEQVAKVARFSNHSGFAKDVLSDIGRLTMKGLRALSMGDLQEVGQLMKENHELLTIMGVNTPLVQQLHSVAAKEALGAKITGAGGGGSIAALFDTKDDETVKRVMKGLHRKGAKVMRVSVARTGLNYQSA